jgi:PilX N-terminal
MTKRREAGSALIVTVMLLMLLGVIGLSALDTVMRDQQVAGFQNRSTAAFYAAEAGLSEAKDEIRSRGWLQARGETFAFNTYATPGEIGDTTLYPYGQPTYYGDPDITDPVKSLDVVVKDPGGGGSNMRIGSGPQWGSKALYYVRVVGSTPDGATSKLEAVVWNRVPQE